MDVNTNTHTHTQTHTHTNAHTHTSLQQIMNNLHLQCIKLYDKLNIELLLTRLNKFVVPLLSQTKKCLCWTKYFPEEAHYLKLKKVNYIIHLVTLLSSKIFLSWNQLMIQTISQAQNLLFCYDHILLLRF